MHGDVGATWLRSCPQSSTVHRGRTPLPCGPQDFLTFAYLVTAKDRFFTQAEFSQLCCQMSDALDEDVELPVAALLKPVELWTGVLCCDALPVEDVSCSGGLLKSVDLWTGVLCCAVLPIAVPWHVGVAKLGSAAARAYSAHVCVMEALRGASWRALAAALCRRRIIMSAHAMLGCGRAPIVPQLPQASSRCTCCCGLHMLCWATTPPQPPLCPGQAAAVYAAAVQARPA